MRINLRLCISLAIFSAAFSQFAKSDSFNNVIDDFDTYLQLEQEGKVPEKPLNIQGQGYDSFSSLPLAPEPKEKSKSAAGKMQAKVKRLHVPNLKLKGRSLSRPRLKLRRQK